MNENRGRKIYTVSELNNEIKTVLEDTYPDIWLEGEISGLKTYSSGHTYFTLKDRESSIAAVLFHGTGRHIKFSFEEGLKVIVRGRVTAYPKRGDYQIIVSFAEPSGIGPLQLAFEQLKTKLFNEGLFDQSKKKKIPLLVQKIGIVTSPDGAALRDILTIIERRYANVEITICPAKVQGDDAKYEIADALDYLNANYSKLDAVLVGRGGGSYQDLWAFNEEIVARAICRSRIPVISCVGHEIDYTIADLAADLRAPTPSAAAELVVQNKNDLLESLDVSKRRLFAGIRSVLDSCTEKLNNLSASRALEKPEALFEMRAQDLDELFYALNKAFIAGVENKERDFERAADKLNLISPLSVLSRGYSICADPVKGGIIKDASALNPGDTVDVTLYRGRVVAVAKQVFPAEKSQ